MPEPKPLIIQAPRQGIAPSPHVGFGNMKNIDIYSKLGVVSLNNILVKQSGVVVDAQVKWIVKNPASPTNLYALDSNGVVYTSANSGTTWTELSDREGAGQGLVVFKDYLIVAEGDYCDAYGPLSGTKAWTDDWIQMGENDSLYEPMLVSNLDGKLYIGNGRYVATVSEDVGENFDPDSASTYTFTAQHLTLPEDYRIKCLAEQGNNLAIGTWQGTNIYDNKVADIFLWDGSSTSYGAIVRMNENGVNAMININENLYILAGIDGKVYKANGTQAWPIAQIPISIADITGSKYFEPQPGAIMNFKSRLFFGVSSQSTDGMGIYSLQETSSGNILNLEHTISSESTGGTNPLIIGALLGITRDIFVVGWRDHATYGIDKLSATSFAYTTNYLGSFESSMYSLGTYLNKREFNAMEFSLAKELAANEGIQIKFRINLTDDWTTLGTYTTTNIGTGVTSFRTEEINIPQCEQLQIKIELLGTATTTPEFKKAIFI